MKRNIYIALFVLLGVLAQAFVQASIEVAYSLLLWKDYETWGFGLSFQDWAMVYRVLAILLFILGIRWGYQGGVYWWRILYQDDGQLRPQYRRIWRI